MDNENIIEIETNDINLDDVHTNHNHNDQNIIHHNNSSYNNTSPLTQGLNQQYFTKHFDFTNGKFYHVIRATNERTWDIPKGDKVPLEPIDLSPLKQCQECNENNHNNTKREQRAYVIQRKVDKYKKEEYKSKLEQQHYDEMKEKEVWEYARKKGLETQGVIRLDWKHFGYISDVIYEFDDNNTSIKLKDLSLNGNDLKSIHDLPTRCLHLQKLSLASNKIHHLDDSIGKLESLTHLNLLQNCLISLPSSIGSLRKLQVLDVSHNCLISLPLAITTLEQIRVLNLECNQLSEIPHDIEKMNCECINLNSNKITMLPRAIGKMSKLKQLSCNDNNLKFLPVELFESKTLNVLHLSRNNISQLPNAIGNLSDTLESLWLDNNQLSALPSHFYQLIHLKDLQLEGNCGMVNPSFSTIAQGPLAVLKWCRLNLARSDYTRKRNIIAAVQDVLEQVDRLKLCGINANDEPHESIFQSNVYHQGEFHYQFILPVFWESLLPNLERLWAQEDQTKNLKGMSTSFPYERWEVEQTLLQFKDAAGRLLHYQEKARFKKCSCICNNGRQNPCPSKPGEEWNCQRMALLFRKQLILENVMIERRRKQNEERRINDAVENAKKIATNYLNSGEGRNEVRLIAENTINKNEHKHHPLNQNISDKYQNRTTDLFNIMISCFPWKRKVEKEIEQTMLGIKNDFIDKEIMTRRAQAIDTNKKLKLVLDAWKGITIEDVFHGWKSIVRIILMQKTQDEHKRNTEEERRLVEMQEKYRESLDDLQKWEMKYDNFNDRHYWKHALTQEIQFEEPRLEPMIGGTYITFQPSEDEKPIKSLDLISKRLHTALDKEHLNAATSLLRKRRQILLEKQI